MAGWNPWHGCTKYSEGCARCYVYRGDAARGMDASVVYKTGEFDLPVRLRRDGGWKIPPGETVWTCFTSDFFLDKADKWRGEAWEMIRRRPDLKFFFITKRIDRLYDVLPPDWGEGYPNVAMGCTMENQRRAEERLPLLLAAPVRHKVVICEPLLSTIDFHGLLDGRINELVAGGESGTGARPCRYEWVLSLREQAVAAGVPFHFKQTGARFIMDGREYDIPRKLQHKQARLAGIDWGRPREFPVEEQPVQLGFEDME